ncbi:translation factor guf1 homolog, mitochondrial [Plakobranchus ocellatus]|uniref:Translation factor guf1 homolog, mitochondrial n=1 Tax=Plakobranchus ocellatus TaxID=259542 RepID=A0AAV4BFJ0_9GAST|nr:translation factor guf1 homolog, mitochondrial [Plakobranchus ocellatus]
MRLTENRFEWRNTIAKKCLFQTSGLCILYTDGAIYYDDGGDDGCDDGGDNGGDDSGDDGCDDGCDNGCDDGSDDGCDDSGNDGCDVGGDNGGDDSGDDGCDDSGDDGCDDGGDNGVTQILVQSLQLSRWLGNEILNDDQNWKTHFNIAASTSPLIVGNPVPLLA